jgi:small subunit ribosomal protein S20
MFEVVRRAVTNGEKSRHSKSYTQEVNVMPNIKSAIKRVKQSEKRRLQNMSQKSALRTSVKTLEVAIASQDATNAQEALVTASKKLDKAVSKGLLHKNAAARKKSRLAKAVNAVSAQS